MQFECRCGNEWKCHQDTEESKCYKCQTVVQILTVNIFTCPCGNSFEGNNIENQRKKCYECGRIVSGILEEIFVFESGEELSSSSSGEEENEYYDDDEEEEELFSFLCECGRSWGSRENYSQKCFTCGNSVMYMDDNDEVEEEEEAEIEDEELFEFNCACGRSWMTRNSEAQSCFTCAKVVYSEWEMESRRKERKEREIQEKIIHLEKLDREIEEFRKVKEEIESRKFGFVCYCGRAWKSYSQYPQTCRGCNKLVFSSNSPPKLLNSESMIKEIALAEEHRKIEEEKEIMKEEIEIIKEEKRFVEYKKEEEMSYIQNEKRMIEKERYLLEKKKQELREKEKKIEKKKREIKEVKRKKKEEKGKVDKKVDEDECGICMERRKDTAFNCGHLVCQSCSVKLKECPFCKKSILVRIKLFF